MGNLTGHAHRAIHELNELLDEVSKVRDNVDLITGSAKKLEQENETLRKQARYLDSLNYIYIIALQEVLANNSASAKLIVRNALAEASKVKG